MTAPYNRTGYHPLGVFAFEALAVAGAPAVGFTAATFTNAIMAAAKVEGGQIRYRTDGTDPTATVGVIANDGEMITVWGSSDLNSIRFIRTGGVSATLNTEYSR